MTQIFAGYAFVYAALRASLKLVAFWVIAGLALGNSLAGGPASPGGRWKTFDDDTGRPKSIVRVTESHGVLEGRIEGLLDPEDSPDGVCELCTDERRNQRIIGLPILRNLRQVEAQQGKWTGGEILDPENGKSYRASLTLSPDGRRLEVRGYIGTPLFGRTQTWQRVD